mgnify:CR=1 FL=1
MNPLKVRRLNGCFDIDREKEGREERQRIYERQKNRRESGRNIRERERNIRDREKNRRERERNRREREKNRRDREKRTKKRYFGINRDRDKTDKTDERNIKR